MEPLHKLVGVVVFAFLSLHIANHLLGLLGPETHLAAMAVLRLVYRQPVVEAVVAVSFVALTLTGLWLCGEIWTRRKDFIHQMKALSGFVLALFLILHLGHIAWGRWGEGADTTLDYAAAPLADARFGEWAYWAYVAGLSALALHLACLGYDIYKKTHKPTGWLVFAAVIALGGVATWRLSLMLLHVAGTTSQS